MTSVSRLRRALEPKGTLVIVGGESGSTWSPGMGRQLKAAAMSPFVSQRLMSILNKEHYTGLDRLAELATNGGVVPTIERSYTLAEVPDAVRRLEAGTSTASSSSPPEPMTTKNRTELPEPPPEIVARPTPPDCFWHERVRRGRHRRRRGRSVRRPGTQPRPASSCGRRRGAATERRRRAHAGLPRLRRPSADRSPGRRPRRGHRIQRPPHRRRDHRHHAVRGPRSRRRDQVRRPPRRRRVPADAASSRGHRPTRRDPRPPRCSRALGPRSAPLSLLPRLRGP